MLQQYPRVWPRKDQLVGPSPSWASCNSHETTQPSAKWSSSSSFLGFADGLWGPVWLLELPAELLVKKPRMVNPEGPVAADCWVRLVASGMLTAMEKSSVGEWFEGPCLWYIFKETKMTGYFLRPIYVGHVLCCPCGH